MRHLAAFLFLAALTTPAAAEPQLLRMASSAPDGTAWARELKALAREIEQQTGGQVKMKWYLGGIAGTDLEAGDRIKRGQLDGVGGGVWQCERWAPSMRVTRLPGLFRNRVELKYVGDRLRTLFDEEFLKAGFINLGESAIGPSMIFLRQPVHTLDELRRVKLWSLGDDLTKRNLLGALGLTLIPSTFDKSRQIFDRKEIDGFLAPPAGALAFQWSTQARYLLDVVTDDILGCVVVTANAFDRLTIEQRQVVMAAMAKFLIRFDDVGAHADQELLGGLFERQGVKMIHPDERFRAEFDKASHAAWKSVGAQLAPPQLLEQVQSLLTDYRAHH